jgi:hypothetical protein
MPDARYQNPASGIRFPTSSNEYEGSRPEPEPTLSFQATPAVLKPPVGAAEVSQYGTPWTYTINICEP